MHNFKIEIFLFCYQNKQNHHRKLCIFLLMISACCRTSHVKAASYQPAVHSVKHAALQLRNTEQEAVPAAFIACLTQRGYSNFSAIKCNVCGLHGCAGTYGTAVFVGQLPLLRLLRAGLHPATCRARTPSPIQLHFQKERHGERKSNLLL